jgi:hypothetical protein
MNVKYQSFSTYHSKVKAIGTKIFDLVTLTLDQLIKNFNLGYNF